MSLHRPPVSQLTSPLNNMDKEVSREDMGLSHLRVARELLERAKELRGTRRVGPNSRFHDGDNSAYDLASEALNNLHYAKEFGVPDLEELEREIAEYRADAAQMIEEKKKER